MTIPVMVDKVQKMILKQAASNC